MQTLHVQCLEEEVYYSNPFTVASLGFNMAMPMLKVRQRTILSIFPENRMNMKKFGPGICASLAFLYLPVIHQQESSFPF